MSLTESKACAFCGTMPVRGWVMRLRRFGLRLQHGMCLIDAKLARERGDKLFAADCQCRAFELECRIMTLHLES